MANLDNLNTNQLLQTRAKKLGKGSGDGKCVLYIMSRDQRVNDNHALVLAQNCAIEKKLPLAVIFCLYPTTGHRSREQYVWMIEGLKQVELSLWDYRIPFIMLLGDPRRRLVNCFKHLTPASVYFDFNPLRGPRNLQMYLAKHTNCESFVVDTHNAIPVWTASNKQEHSARTLRPKLFGHLDKYLEEPQQVVVHPYGWSGKVMKITELKDQINNMLAKLDTNKESRLSEYYPSGEKISSDRLSEFINSRLANYSEKRNDLSSDSGLGLSPYLHFGQISSLRILLEVTKEASNDFALQKNIDALTEELVIRKELSDNFCYYNSDYDNLDGAPLWAQKTLSDHANDVREHIYTLEQLKLSETHDPAWNASQKQMVVTGKMNSYMRMYWAKKVLEWSESPTQAIERLIYLNDFYSIDGGDPNGYTGIMWSISGVHDRPWKERSVYGTIRSMVYSGLKRKFDIAEYEKEWS